MFQNCLCFSFKKLRKIIIEAYFHRVTTFCFSIKISIAPPAKANLPILAKKEQKYFQIPPGSELGFSDCGGASINEDY